MASTADAPASAQRQYDSRSLLHVEMVHGAEFQGSDVRALLKDVVLAPPPAAAATVQGRGAANGKLMWKTEAGATYGDLLDSQV